MVAAAAAAVLVLTTGAPALADIGESCMAVSRDL
jgi:hypothetical protein